MLRDSLHKIILYNYLYEFSLLEDKIKGKFKQVLLEKDDEDIKNNFLLLHLSEEIKLSFTEDIQKNAFQINKKHYTRDIEKVKIKWNLKKQLEFAKINNFFSEILPMELDLFGKIESYSMYSFIETSIQLRNALAHETFNVKFKRDMLLLSDEKLDEMLANDKAFDDLSYIAEIDQIYKHVLTYYFYLKEVENKLLS